MSEKTLRGQMEDEIKRTLDRRNKVDDQIQELDSALRQEKHNRDLLTEHAFRLRKAAWALEGKTGNSYTDDHATGQNDKDARAIREVNLR